MGNSQWGHGYYRGLAEAQENSDTLVGLWFHTFTDDGAIQFQGSVVRKVGEDTYLVQFYSFMDGMETNQKLISIAEMPTWDFYATAYCMRMAYYQHHRMSQEDIEHTERCLELTRSLCR